MVRENKGSGIVIFESCHVSFIDHPSIIANNYSLTNGGGMWIEQKSYIASNTTVHFINNTAKGLGGAIFDSYSHPNNNHFIAYDSACSSFTPTFNNNNALTAGDNVYGGSYWNCWYAWRGRGKYAKFVNYINCSVNPRLTHFPKPLSSYITSDPVGVCTCSDNVTVNCSKRLVAVQLYPGQSINFSLVTVGVCGGISPGELLVTSNTGGVDVLLKTVYQKTERNCKNFTYQFKQHSTYVTKAEIKVGTLHQQSMKNQIGSSLTVDVTFKQCPDGLSLMDGTCQCNQIIASNGTQCNLLIGCLSLSEDLVTSGCTTMTNITVQWLIVTVPLITVIHLLSLSVSMSLIFSVHRIGQVSSVDSVNQDSVSC